MAKYAAFVVNRYKGDDSGEDFQSNQEKLILEKLKQQAEERRQTLLSKELPTGNGTAAGEVSGRKRKVDLNQNENEQSCGSSVKRRKTLPVKDDKGIKSNGDLVVDTEAVDGKKIRRSRKKHKKKQSLPSAAPTEAGGFTVLGEVISENKAKVARVLPEWLAQPTVITIDLHYCPKKVSDVNGLHDSILRRLKSNGIEHFFPVQATVIPWLLQNITRNLYRARDICVSAPTGSGKTLAFALPIIQALMPRVVVAVRALVVLPVRELAIQVHKVFQSYCEGTGLKVGLTVANNAMAQEQSAILRQTTTQGPQSSVDIIIATPGRLVDHILKTKGFTLQHLQFLVIDEADRMIDEIKQDWLNYVEQSMFTKVQREPNQPTITCGPTVLTAASAEQWKRIPQKMLFSATLSQNPEKLQQLNLFQPKLFTSVVAGSKGQAGEATDRSGEFIGKYTTPAELEELYVECDQSIKPLVLHYLVEVKNYTSVLCFTNNVETTHRLALLLNNMGKGVVCEFSSNMKPSKRSRILHQFEQGNINMLICSDAMARGMDVKNVRFVISYDVPPHVNTYIHRIGRTARAGRPGVAISFLAKDEAREFQELLVVGGKEQVMELRVDEQELETFEDLFKESLHSVEQTLSTEKFQPINRRKRRSLKKKHPGTNNA